MSLRNSIVYWTYYFGVIVPEHLHFVADLFERFGKAQGRPRTRQFEPRDILERVNYDVKDSKDLSGFVFDSESQVFSTRQHVPLVRHPHTSHK